MTISFLFWLLMVLWLVLGVVGARVDINSPNGRYVVWGGGAIFFFLFLLLGIGQWGWPIKG